MDEKEVQEIIRIYPHYFDTNYGVLVKCPPVNQPEAEYNSTCEEFILPFKKIMPIFMCIELVVVYRRLLGCVYRVTYRMNNGGDIPKGARLEQLLTYVERYKPENTTILHEERKITFPKRIDIFYAVTCNCHKQYYFDKAQQPATVQLLEVFQQLTVDK